MKNIKETKENKFIRLAEARTNKIIETIKLLGNLSNRSIYEYKEEYINKIFLAIEQELKNSKQKFTTQNKKNDKFSLRK